MYRFKYLFGKSCQVNGKLGLVLCSSLQSYLFSISVIQNVDDQVFVVFLFTHVSHKLNIKSYARFLRLRAFAVDPAFDTLALPVLMVYKNGQLIGNVVRVCDEFESLTKDNVKSFLDFFCRSTLPTHTLPATAHKHQAQHPDFDDEELDGFCSDFNCNNII